MFASRYMLVRKLGAGGFSEVWLAGDTKTGVEVALKIYAPRGGMDDDGIKVFSSEYSGVFNLNHSNLLRPSYYDVEGSCPYLVMPYISNGSAKKYVGHMPEEEVWKFIRDVASGLAYMHSIEPPMIHQDIKPDNVLIDNRGVYQITDFGISVKARSTLRKSAMAAGVSSSGGGTQAYMGPERFGKDPMPIKASDVWSLGSTLFELMEGDAPFGEMGGLIQKSGAEIPNFHNNYSKELKDLVVACLAPETWDRPRAIQLAEYADDMIKGRCPVAPWIKGEDIKKTKPITPEPPTPTPSGKRHWVITAYLILLLIVNVISLFLNGLPIDALGSYAGFHIDAYMVSFVMNVINVIALIMLLKNVKAGFWVICGTCVVNTIVGCIIGTGDNVATCIGALIGMGIFALILNIKKNGVSGWKLLKPMNTLKKRFYIISVLLILVSIAHAVIYARNNVSVDIYSTEVEFDSEGGSDSRTVRAGGDIDVDDYCGWISSYNIGNEVYIDCEKNTSTETRLANVYVTCRNVVRTIEVTQTGINPTLELSTSSVNLSASGGSRTITVDANCKWTLDNSSAGSWVTSSKSGSEIRVNCGENTTTNSRSATLYVNYGNKRKSISIYQAGKENYLRVNGGTSSITKSFDSDGGRTTYSVDCSYDSYTTWGVPSWCSVESKTSSSFVLKCEANTSSASRSDYMEVRSNGKAVRINIKQSGKTTAKSSTTSNNKSSSTTTKSASIEKAWTDFNVYEDGAKGMKIHVKFRVDGFKSVDGRVIAYFRYKNGNDLADKNGRYCTVNNKVSVGGDITPGYDNTIYEDYTLFIPYDELHLGSGKTDLQYHIEVHFNGDSFDESDYYDFQFTK